MKIQLLAGMAFAAFSMLTPAMAADLPVPVKAVRPVCIWCGVYVGFNVGYAWGHDDVTATPTGLFPQDPNAGLFTSLGTHGFRENGFTGGGQIGVNSMWNGLLFGLEGDIQYLGLKSSRASGAVIGTPPILGADPTVFTFTDSVKSSWVATVRPRVGFVVGNTVLFYGTVGLAFGEQKFSQSYTAANVFPASPDPLVFTTTGGGSSNRVAAGWTGGGGIEWKFAPNWSMKAEYLHIDLGTVKFDSGMSAPLQAFTVHHTSRLTADIARLGVNYALWTH